MAQMTTEEFMDSANQAQVAKVVTQAVGPNVPVMTGVRTASGDCLTVEAVGDDTVWTQSDCEEAAPALCVAESPAVRACSLTAYPPPERHTITRLVCRGEDSGRRGGDGNWQELQPEVHSSSFVAQEDSNLFVATVPAEIGEVPVTVEASISIHPVSFLMAGLCATALFGVMQVSPTPRISTPHTPPLNSPPQPPEPTTQLSGVSY
jgi:hypothetical protein